MIIDKLDEITKKAEVQDLNSDELLRIKSRTYYPAIKLLEESRGIEEAPKENDVRIAYNLFRHLDQGEDIPTDKNSGKNAQELRTERIGMINRIAYICGEIAKREYIEGKGIEDIILGDEARSVTKWLIENEPDKIGKIFAEHFGRGVVWRDFYEIGKEGEVGTSIKKSLDYSIKSMAHGMIIFIERGPIETLRQLDDYCDMVAGNIGKIFLNELVKLKDKDECGNPIKLDDFLAEQLAKYLQLTNIAKNVRSDYEEGRRFFPGSWIHKGISFESMMDGNSVDAIAVRQKVLNKVLSFAQNKFNYAMRYINQIPYKLSGYKAFCLFPVILAQKTLENMREAGTENVFNGIETAVKIPYGIKNILEFSRDIVKCPEDNLKSWLTNYARHPSQFIFKDAEYNQWSKNYLK